MLQSIIAGSLRQRLVLVVVALVLVGFGINAAQHLSVDAFPDVANVQVQIATEASGKSPEEVARLAEMGDEELNSLEQRDDAKLSAIRRYVRALGGELELVVVLKTGHRMRLDI